ncbi:hypothetical protein CYY_000129, partial [Polysphondylium violaceum]
MPKKEHVDFAINNVWPEICKFLPQGETDAEKIEYYKEYNQKVAKAVIFSILPVYMHSDASKLKDAKEQKGS